MGTNNPGKEREQNAPSPRSKQNDGKGSQTSKQDQTTSPPPQRQGGAMRKGERPIADVDRKVRGGDA